MRSRSILSALPVVAVAAFGLVSCGDDDDAGGTTTPVGQITNPALPPTTTDGGGGMSAGAPSFTSFDVSGSVPCEDGNATATMSFETINVVSIEIKIGDGEFESTAGYGPNESDVVASIPCSGAGESSIQLRGCTEDDECAESESKTVTITG
ncbi:MAG: hypothetical protein ABW219_03850 [Ilumatobacteraceae bacterium]